MSEHNHSTRPHHRPRRRLSRARGGIAALSLAVLAALLALVPAQAGAQGHFSDTANHFAHDDINFLMDRGVLGDGWSTWCGPSEFCPRRPVQRWMAAVWMVRALDGRDPDPITESSFSDINPAHFWAPHIERVAELGVAYGYTDGTFRPFVEATRAHAVSFLERGAQNAELNRLAPGADTILLRAGLVASHGCDNGGLACRHEKVTRGELAALIANGERGAFLNSPASPPGGTFKSVSAGSFHTCGIRDNWKIECWGIGIHGQTKAPDGDFWAISAGGSHNCAIRNGNDRLHCWGRNNHGQASPPDGGFRAVTAGDIHSCGIRHDWTITCWGSRRDLLDWHPVVGKWSDISAAGHHTCAIRNDPDNWDPGNDGRVKCWGRRSVLDTPLHPFSHFSQITAGLNFTCGIYLERSDIPENKQRTTSCFGDGYTDYGQLRNPDTSNTAYGNQPYMQIDAGWWHACAILYHPASKLLHPDYGEWDGGWVECWGRNNANQLNSPASTYIDQSFMRDISVGGIHACGILLVGRNVKCWGFRWG